MARGDAACVDALDTRPRANASAHFHRRRARLVFRLRDRRPANHRFRRQHPLAGYFADFACVERKLIVETDGGQHVECASLDESRTRSLEQLGWRVIRFWDDDVLLRCDDVLEAILREMLLRPR